MVTCTKALLNWRLVLARASRWGVCIVGEDTRGRLTCVLSFQKVLYFNKVSCCVLYFLFPTSFLLSVLLFSQKGWRKQRTSAQFYLTVAAKIGSQVVPNEKENILARCLVVFLLNILDCSAPSWNTGEHISSRGGSLLQNQLPSDGDFLLTAINFMAIILLSLISWGKDLF